MPTVTRTASKESPVAPASPEISQDRCGECGVPTRCDDLVALGPTRVCAACKPMALALLQEGGSIGRADRTAAHRVGDCIRVPAGTRLPTRCVLCNTNANRHLQQRLSPNFPAWLLPLTLAPFIGQSLGNWLPSLGNQGGIAGLGVLLSAVFFHPLITRQVPPSVDVPMCETHFQRRRLWLRFAIAAITIGCGITLLSWIRFQNLRIPWNWTYGPALLTFAGALVGWLRSSVVRLAPGPANTIELRGAGKSFRDSLPETLD